MSATLHYVDGVTYRRYDDGSDDAPCGCLGIGGRAHTSHDCPWERQRARPRWTTEERASRWRRVRERIDGEG